MKHRSKAQKLLFIIPMVIAVILLLGLVVMGLWNAILPQVIGVSAISFWQALGILLLSKILFGGFGKGGGFGRRRMEWKRRMQEKWEGMNPEERERFKAEWKNRCGMQWQPQETTVKDTAAE